MPHRAARLISLISVHLHNSTGSGANHRRTSGSVLRAPNNEGTAAPKTTVRLRGALNVRHRTALKGAHDRGKLGQPFKFIPKGPSKEVNNTDSTGS